MAAAAEVESRDGAPGPGGVWRTLPGFLHPGTTDVSSVQILLGRFLADRVGPSPLPERTLFSADGRFRWGAGPPLEKVVSSRAELEFLALHPRLVRSAVAIVEPWDHVGRDAAGQPLRASTNVAYLLQKTADCDSILFPVWQSGVLDLEVLVPVLGSCVGVIFEGGDPSVHDPSTFSHPICPRDDLFALVERLLLGRSLRSAPCVFVCLGHQLAAECLVRLLRRTVAEVGATTAIPRDRDGDALTAVQDACERIRAIGEKLEVRKTDGRGSAQGWLDGSFAVTRNEAAEAGTRILRPYRPPSGRTSHVPKPLVIAHQVVADAYEAVIDTAVGREREIAIEMFHGDEVNEEAVLFANWALGTLHDAMIPYRHVLAASDLAWLLGLPCAVEILCSTSTEQGVLTECAALGIYYRDAETRRTRRSFTCQFHPELLAGQREVGRSAGPPPSYSELKRDDGARLFVRMLYEGLHE
jgi:hypothetical protein